MGIDEVAKAREFTDRPSDELSKGNDDSQVGCLILEGLKNIRIPDLFGAQQGDVFRPGTSRDRRRGELSSASPTPIGLTDHRYQVVPTLDQSVQSGHGQLGRAEEDDAKRLRGRQGDLLRLFRGQFLLALLDVQTALEPADAIDEKDAVEMVAFVLHADGAKPGGFMSDLFAVKIE